MSREDKKIRKISNIDGKFLNGRKNKNNSSLDIVFAYSKEDGICYLRRKRKRYRSNAKAT